MRSGTETTTGEGVGVCSKKRSDIFNKANLGLVVFPKANFDVTKAHDVPIFDHPCFSIRNPAAVYERTVS